MYAIRSYYAEDARAEGVIAALQPFLAGGTRVLLPRAEIAREVLGCAGSLAQGEGVERIARDDGVV